MATKKHNNKKSILQRSKKNQERESSVATSSDLTSWREAPLLGAKGFCMGFADIVPGVSGGTMALILGIYERLINAVKSVNSKVLWEGLCLNWREALAAIHWKFLGILFLGIMAALVFFTRIVALPQLMKTHPEPIYGLFFGLIIGSIWFVLKDSRFSSAREALWVITGCIIGLRVVTLMPADTPHHPVFIFFSGMLAVTAMVLPGISGSFILLILRQYEYILSQFARLLGGNEAFAAILILIPFILGMICGIALFARILSWLLHHWRRPTYLILAGFMIGSLWVIWPWQNRSYETVQGKERLISSTPILPELGNIDFYLGLAMILIGAAAVISLEIIIHQKDSVGNPYPN